MGLSWRLIIVSSCVRVDNCQICQKLDSRRCQVCEDGYFLNSEMNCEFYNNLEYFDLVHNLAKSKL